MKCMPSFIKIGGAVFEKNGQIQGPPSLTVIFQFAILGTYQGAAMVYFGSNWPKLNDIL